METIQKPKKLRKQDKENKINLFKKRMLVWDSPVEYVNNMYGCHANEARLEYFKTVFDDESGKS
jgi:hypothetical protein